MLNTKNYQDSVDELARRIAIAIAPILQTEKTNKINDALERVKGFILDQAVFISSPEIMTHPLAQGLKEPKDKALYTNA